MGPIAFIVVFMLVPLIAALFVAAFFASVGIYRLLSAVPAGAWVGLTVTAGLLLAARLWVVLRALRNPTPGRDPGGVTAPG